MSEAYQNYNPPVSEVPSLEAAAANFRSKVEEASNRLSGAAEQFVTMSDGLLAAVEQARQAAERAEAAQRSIEAMQAQMAQNYGNVDSLVRELQQRIAALATLAQPLPGQGASPMRAEPEQHHEPEHQEHHNPGESSW